MKTKILALVVLLAAFWAGAQTNTNTLGAGWLYERKLFIKEHSPLRVFDGKLYDFSEFFTMSSKWGLQTAEGNFSKWAFQGVVFQVLDDSLLVETGSRGLVRVTGHPLQSDVIDGEEIHVFAKFKDRFRYTTTIGSTKAIEWYECGRIYRPETDTFTNKIVVRSGNLEYKLPVTEWDKPDSKSANTLPTTKK